MRKHFSFLCLLALVFVVLYFPIPHATSFLATALGNLKTATSLDLDNATLSGLTWRCLSPDVEIQSFLDSRVNFAKPCLAKKGALYRGENGVWFLFLLATEETTVLLALNACKWLE